MDDPDTKSNQKEPDISKDCPGSKTTTHIFSLRLWRESIGEGRTEWRGRFARFNPPQVTYFRELQTIPEQLQKMLSESEFADSAMDQEI